MITKDWSVTYELYAARWKDDKNWLWLDFIPDPGDPQNGDILDYDTVTSINDATKIENKEYLKLLVKFAAEDNNFDKEKIEIVKIKATYELE